MTKRLAIALIVAVGIASTGVRATTLTKFIDVTGPGLKLANGGVGLENLGAGTATLSISVPGKVQKAILYWAGRDSPCGMDPCTVPFEPYKDQELRLDGTLVVGTLTGQEAIPEFDGEFNNIGYRADVTSIVQAKGQGNVTFAIEDADLNNNLLRLNGAGLLVIYKDYQDLLSRFFPSRIIIFDGLDFAYDPNLFPKTPGTVTVPISVDHGATWFRRPAELTLFVGDAVGGGNSVSISNNGTLATPFDMSDGEAWDTDKVNITIPANVGTTSMQVFSGPGPVPVSHDSLLWQVAALRVPFVKTEKETGCSPGFWKNHKQAWTNTGYFPTQTFSSVFGGSPFPTLTLYQALQLGGGPGTLGGAKILVRAAVAALLNSAHPDVNYPRTTADVINSVQLALNSNSRQTMLALATALDNDNNLGCKLGCKTSSHWKNGKHHGDD